MSEPIFPTLVGRTFPITRKQRSSTIVQTSASGLETRVPNQAYVRYEWNLSFSILDAAAAIADFQTLFGFLEKLNGMAVPFLFKDDTDFQVTGQPIATGDGVTTVFQLVRTFGASVAPVYAPIASGLVIHGGGANTVDPLTGLLTYSSAPAGGVAITADFQYYWRSRMLQDDPTFEEFDSGGWELKKLNWLSCQA